MKKPTLAYIWLNEVDDCLEQECIGCEFIETDEGGRHAPPSVECTCDDADRCPAAQRILVDFMDDYEKELDNE